MRINARAYGNVPTGTYLPPTRISSSSLIPPSKMRVRQILDSMTTRARNALAKLLPAEALTPPAVETQKYPSALLNNLPKPDNYALLGVIAEALLGRPSPTLDDLIREGTPYFVAGGAAKVRASKTTAPFLEAIVATRAAITPILGADVVQYEPTLAVGHVQGHPDMKTPTQVLEVKLTGQLDKNWKAFLLQTFAYAALDTGTTHVHVVLPLQRHVWSYDVRGWANRAKYLAALEKGAVAEPAAATLGLVEIPLTGDPMALLMALAGLAPAATALAATGAGAALPPPRAHTLVDACCIGSHTKKMKTVLETVKALDPSKPWQIFLSSNLSSKVNVKPADSTATAAYIAESKLAMYVHTPYIINLSMTPGEKEDYVVKCLRDNTSAAVAMGFRGVVVHVGKATDKPLPVAIANMKANLLAALDVATPECPILLETPAGQGSETLTKYEEFVGFVKEVGDPRLRLCVDTCHVFSCGHDPLAYITRLAAEDRDLLKLIHFNDSAVPCGACCDRHAYIGTGKIGIDTMESIGHLAKSLNIPCVIE